MIDALNRLSPHAHWLVRLSFAATFLFHGIGKLFALKMMAEMMGMPIAMILMVALFEIGAGVLVLVGGAGPDWATRIGGLLAVPIMLGAIFMVHIKNGFDMMNGGAEFQILLLAVGLFFVLRGNLVKGSQ
jgi:uncharacterized membrane protein YphA (DoxX/SURF4 family)